MADLVRLFTCASVLALGGLATTTGMLACSSDPAPAAPGDDDDDTGDDDDSSGDKDGGGKTDPSTKDAGDPAAKCEPVGTYTISKPEYTVSDPGPTGGSVCQAYVNGGNAQGQTAEVVITKLPNGDYHAVSTTKNGDKSELDLKRADTAPCQIGGGIGSEGIPASDADGKDIIAKFIGTQFYDFNGGQIVSKVNTKIESDPEGAKGTNCFWTSIAAGVKK